MITNEQGQVAIVYGQSIPKVVSVGSKNYAFVVQFTVSLAWVDAPDVALLLALKGRGCCGNRQATQFDYATVNQVQVWKTGHY